jgi:hypothetical protein
MVVLERYIDAETGEEIVVFERRGKRIMMVRDAETKRFIRGVKGITISVAIVFESKGRKHNPLYVDVKCETYRPVDEEKSVEEIEKELASAGIEIITSHFGEDVASMAKVAGIEHKSEVIDEIYPEYHWYLVWHHYKNDQKEEDGVGRL